DQIYSLSLHDALPIFGQHSSSGQPEQQAGETIAEAAPERHFLMVEIPRPKNDMVRFCSHFPAQFNHVRNQMLAIRIGGDDGVERSEEHTSELQSRENL